VTESHIGDIVTSKTYGISSELGEINTMSHAIENSGKTVYNSGSAFFEGKASRERFKSNRFMDLILDYSTDTSNRKAATRLNRLRLEETGINATTYRNTVEREGEDIQKHIKQKCEEALMNNGFNNDGEKLEDSAFLSVVPEHIEQAVIEDAAIRLNMWEYNAADYENPAETVNVSLDDVCVKRQTETRPGDKENQPKRVDNTVLHIQVNCSSYILNATSILDGLKLLIGFLLLNGLMKKQIVIFADGARNIHAAVTKMLSFANCKIILDWFHLKKKCQEQLSMALKGSKIRNEFLDGGFLSCLWFGNIDGAIKRLQNIDPKKVKNFDYIVKLTEYLERVRGQVPCYALRKELGLRNSSNLGEKSNDIIVADRQKHNGMSWSNDGSVAFATVAAASHNREINRWTHSRTINLELRKHAA
jgi:hypothetical protein